MLPWIWRGSVRQYGYRAGNERCAGTGIVKLPAQDEEKRSEGMEERNRVMIMEHPLIQHKMIDAEGQEYGNQRVPKAGGGNCHIDGI